jgi:cyanophycinase
MAAIRRRHAAGALVGGMSDGAAAMPALMIKGGETEDLTAIKSGGTEIGAGLGFWPEVITDQHFVKRQRFARLVSAVLDKPAFPGIAIDEETAILVSGDSFEIFGKGSVIVIDARRAKVWQGRERRGAIRAEDEDVRSAGRGSVRLEERQVGSEPLCDWSPLTRRHGILALIASRAHHPCGWRARG